MGTKTIRMFVSPPRYQRFPDPMRSNLTDIEVHVHHETEKAILVSLDGDKEHAQWLPKACIEVEFDAATLSRYRGNKWRGIANITLPVRLATEKGLI